MSRPRLLVTGASGFIGRHIVAALQHTHEIHAFARRAPHEARAPEGANITWYQVDLGDDGPLDEAFDRIAAGGDLDHVLHLAAYYDFTGKDDAEYERTNVLGLRNVLSRCRRLHPKKFVFASSLAACQFPAPGTVLTERSPVNGSHPYARSKRVGEEMLAEFAAEVPAVIVRMGAIYSDWCEFTPLYALMRSWCSTSLRARMIAGRGTAALPYLHVRDVVGFFARVLERARDLGNGEVLIASPDQATSHRQLFEATLDAYAGSHPRPRLIPRYLVRLGLHLLGLAGKIAGRPPFEQPWMADYVDKAMPVDASQTRQRLGWAPNPRFTLLRRMPFLVENLKTQTHEWNRRNLAAMKSVQVPNHLRIFQLLETHERDLVEVAVTACRDPEHLERFPNYRHFTDEELATSARQTFTHLKNAIRTREKAVFRAHCEALAERRFARGFAVEEVVDINEVKRDACLRVLLADPRARGLEAALIDAVHGTFRMGIDQLHDTFDQLSGRFVPLEPPG
ncbi:MAG: NAD-dependent epimerase/dehydratase family protein [Deltaproteobacteria bacterium]|nr:NAD-dependent epimerase/dehydratase family protein [Deltaproteobacteria bacterium]